MEEYHDFGCSNEFDHPLAENDRRGLANLVKEDTETGDCAENASSVSISQPQPTIFLLFDKVRCWESIRSFRSPLLFFTESPQDEATSQEGGKR